MAEKQEIVTQIQAGIERVNETFGSLSDPQLDQQVHEGEGGWTARQILAHLAGRADGYDMLFQMAKGGAGFSSGDFDVDTWNQQHVDARADKSRDELLEEFRNAHRAIIERVETVDDETLQTKVPSPRGGEMAVSDMLMGSAGRHSIMHAEEVERALAG